MKVFSTPITNNTTITSANNIKNTSINFFNLVKSNLNKLSNLKSQEILNLMNYYVPVQNRSIVSESINDLKNKLNKQESNILKSLINEDSLIDTVTSITEAKHTLLKIKTIRDQITKTLNEIVHMEI